MKKGFQNAKFWFPFEEIDFVKLHVKSLAAAEKSSNFLNVKERCWKFVNKKIFLIFLGIPRLQIQTKKETQAARKRSQASRSEAS